MEIRARSSTVELVDSVGPAAPLAELDRQYFRWLSAALPLVKASDSPDGVTLFLAGVPLIRLGRASTRARELYRPILGGWLALPGGELVFSEDHEDAVLRIRGYTPRLPRWLYRWTQQRAHRSVARWFAASRMRS